jgi:hypothetical protein
VPRAIPVDEPEAAPPASDRRAADLQKLIHR